MIPQESELKVRFVASDPFGGGNLRSFWPAEAIKPRVLVSKAEVKHPKPEPDVYDVVVIHRPLFMGTYRLVQDWQRVGAYVLVDEDDDLSRINQTKNQIGLREWVPEAVKMHDLAMEIADGVTVSTDTLAEVYRERNANIHVCRNYLPRRFAAIRRGPRVGRDGLRVGWAGITETHLHDLEWIIPVARQMMQGAMFSTVGDARTPHILGLYGHPYETFPFQNTPDQLYKLMARCDVAIVPLAPSEFNAAKSWLKALEYMILGKPVVATRLPEQEKLIEHGVTGFLAETPEEMVGYVQTLLKDHALRATMSTAAKDRAIQMVSENHAEEWLTAIRSVGRD